MYLHVQCFQHETWKYMTCAYMICRTQNMESLLSILLWEMQESPVGVPGPAARSDTHNGERNTIVLNHFYMIGSRHTDSACIGHVLTALTADLRLQKWIVFCHWMPILPLVGVLGPWFWNSLSSRGSGGLHGITFLKLEHEHQRRQVLPVCISRYDVWWHSV